MLLIILTVLSADLRPINLDELTLDRARILDGKVVTVSFVVAKPAYTLLGRTMVGAADRDDGVECGAVLLGRRFDVRDNERLTVRGTLRTIYHRPAFVNCVPVVRTSRRSESSDPSSRRAIAGSVTRVSADAVVIVPVLHSAPAWGDGMH